MSHRCIRAGAVLAASLFISGCDMVLPQDLEGPHEARVGTVTRQRAALFDVPPPKQQVTIAVYRMPDKTGQYRELSSGGQALSTMVTQGAGDILIRALQDAGDRSWFKVLDRSNFENIARERQIVTEMRRIYLDEKKVPPDVLPPLLHAGIIIEGGVIGYDTNLQSGGVGARYLGIGANSRWKLDIITVGLRAVSSTTGEVLANVVARKPIASVSLQGNVFRYVALDELLEMEAGLATNEPKQIAVEQAIEKAVMALIAEGAMNGVWLFADHARGQQFTTQYLQQKFGKDVIEEAELPKAQLHQATGIPSTQAFVSRRQGDPTAGAHDPEATRKTRTELPDPDRIPEAPLG